VMVVVRGGAATEEEGDVHEHEQQPRHHWCVPATSTDGLDDEPARLLASTPSHTSSLRLKRAEQRSR
jgi:hypothetical protein